MNSRVVRYGNITSMQSYGFALFLSTYRNIKRAQLYRKSSDGLSCGQADTYRLALESRAHYALSYTRVYLVYNVISKGTK